MKINLNRLIPAALALSLFMSTSAHAKFFACKAVSLKMTSALTENTTIPTPKLEFGPEGKGHDVGVLVADDMVALCKSGGAYYKFSATGLGGSLHFNNNYFTLSCPLVGKRRFNKDGGAVFYGARVSATALVGGNAGAYINHALGVCVMAGATVGLGASATIGAMKIEKMNNSHLWGEAIGEILGY